jgi:hypothetical protein
LLPEEEEDGYWFGFRGGSMMEVAEVGAVDGVVMAEWTRGGRKSKPANGAARDEVADGTKVEAGDVAVVIERPASGRFIYGGENDAASVPEAAAVAGNGDCVPVPWCSLGATAAWPLA